MDGLEKVIFQKSGQINAEETVMIGHADIKAAYLALCAREVIEEYQSSHKIQNIRQDLKVMIGGSKNKTPIIVISGNMESLGGDQPKIESDIAERLAQESGKIGYSRSSAGPHGKIGEELNKPIVHLFINPQSTDLQNNAVQNGNGNGGKLPEVAGDTAIAQAGAILDTPERVNYELAIGRKISQNLSRLISDGALRGGYDGKINVFGEYDRKGMIYSPRKIVVAKQHDQWDKKGELQSLATIEQLVWENSIVPVLTDYGIKPDKKIFIFNNAGPWHQGGEIADMGEGCDHIFWGNNGYRKKSDPQVGEDPSKTDGLEFMARAISKASLEVLQEFGAYEVITEAGLTIGERQLTSVSLTIKDSNGGVLYAPAQSADIARILFQTQGGFPISTKEILTGFTVPAKILKGYLQNGNIFGYTPSAAPDLPWENITPFVQNIGPKLREYAQSAGK